MSGVRDPAFWKRFSTAVHLDEEGGYGHNELKHSDSWLARQNRKKSRRKFLCPIFWLCFFLFVTAMVGVIIWLLKSGILANVKIGNGHGTPNQPANPNGGIMGGNKRRGLEGLVRKMLVEGVR